MPLLDHFHPPLFPLHRWESFHGQWAGMLVQHLNEQVLPEQYFAAPFVHLVSGIEVDVAALDPQNGSPGSGGLAVLPYAPPRPRLTFSVELPQMEIIEVQVLEQGTGRLVAAIELVSPANKDRPANRSAFAMKCAGMLQGGASVLVIDLVPGRRSNFIQDILALFQCRPDPQDLPPALYAAAFRTRKPDNNESLLETWPEDLIVGQPLPTLPLWVDRELALPLDLEETYDRTCRALRLPAENP